jgi:fructosamine-3-kinase
MRPTDAGIAAAVRQLLGTGCRTLGSPGGGSLSTLWRLVLDDGSLAILKYSPAARTEAAMLRALGAAGAPVPAVLAVADDRLILETLAHDAGPGSAWRDLGAVMARVHATRDDRYGWADDYAFGSVAICNRPGDDWLQFWGEHRLAEPAAVLPAGLRRRVEILAGDLANRLPRRPSPSLLHGDLWSGNVLAAGGRITGLIDPACYFGDAEVDLAMLGLFDSPPAGFFDSYGPRAAGWRERLPIYQLWPAIVHARLFGSGYHGLVRRLLAQTGV